MPCTCTYIVQCFCPLHTCMHARTHTHTHTHTHIHLCTLSQTPRLTTVTSAMSMTVHSVARNGITNRPARGVGSFSRPSWTHSIVQPYTTACSEICEIYAAIILYLGQPWTTSNSWLWPPHVGLSFFFLPIILIFNSQTFCLVSLLKVALFFFTTYYSQLW